MHEERIVQKIESSKTNGYPTKTRSGIPFKITHVQTSLDGKPSSFKGYIIQNGRNEPMYWDVNNGVAYSQLRAYDLVWETPYEDIKNTLKTS